jgi:LysM repeat protein
MELMRKNIHMIYEVKPGETLFTVASKFGTSVDKLQELNGIDEIAVLPGSRLKIDK